jgi:purine nucleoside phosphorylase
MKRDMELIRTLLLRSEGDEAAVRIADTYSVEERAYHVQLMVDAGFVEAIVHRNADGAPIGAITSRLTWAGHDFLDAMRDDTIWKKAKEHVLKPGASWTFDLLKEWLKVQAKEKLGIPLS